MEKKMPLIKGLEGIYFKIRVNLLICGKKNLSPNNS